MGDASEDRIAREEQRITLERALGDVGIGGRYFESSAPQRAPQLADCDPVFERSAVHRRFLKQFTDRGAIVRCPGSADQLCDDERRDDYGALLKGDGERIDLLAAEMRDPDGRISDDAGHATCRCRCRG